MNLVSVAHSACVYQYQGMIRTMFICLFLLSACGESVQPEKVAAPEQQTYQQNATDAVGVAEGDTQVSPFGKPAH